MFLMLAVLACTGEPAGPDRLIDGVATVTEATPPIQTMPDRAVPAPRPPPPDAPLPAAELVLDDCYRPMPRYAPRPTPYGGGGYGAGARGSSSGDASRSPPMAKPPAKSKPQPPPMELAAPSSAPVAAEPSAEPVAADPAPPKDSLTVARERNLDEEAKRRGPTLDWGATVHLSNDDSMSLASAQRVLWRLDRGQVPPVAEVRPHELLNYFSFDTAAVPDGETFSVLGSAVQEGDQLTVGLAVRGAMPEPKPLDLTLLVDRSCSMSAEGRMDYTRRGLLQMTEQLHKGDRIDLILFDTRVCAPVKNFVVGRDDPAVLRDAIERMRPQGGTNLHAALQEGYSTQTARDPGETRGRNRRVMLVTDALLNEGKVDEHLVSEVGRHLDDHGIRLTGVGVGRQFNDSLLNRLTEKGKGAYVYLGSEAVVDRVFGAGFRSLVQTLAHDVRFSLELPPSLAMERFYGEESSTNEADIQPIHYYAGTTQLFLQDLAIRDGRVAHADPLTFHIRWRDADTGEPEELRLRTTVGALLDGDTRNVHKGRALMAWSDVILGRAMGGDGCGDPLRSYLQTAQQLADDAEIAYTTGLIGRICKVGPTPPPPPPPKGAQLKVKVDADVAIAEVGLTCGGRSWTQRLSGSDTVARFDAATPGSCALTLHGAVPMQATVQVPSTGADLRCIVRAGRVSCS